MESGKIFIISNSGSDPVILGLTDLSNNIVGNFNGDDPLVLKKNGVIIDSIGQIGTDPGTNWSANGVNTSEMTLVRKSTVTTGDTDPKDVFDPSVDWIAYPQNTFSYLGSHTMEASGPVDPKTVAAVTASSTSQYVVENTEIKLSTETAGATIYYTLDGSDPTSSSTLYSDTAPIKLDDDTTIKAIAINGEYQSEMKEFNYQVVQSGSVADAVDRRW